MSTPFQNRLVGSIIVAAAVIIFLPDILDGEKKTFQSDFDAIPQAPEFKSKNNKAQEFPEQKLTAIVNEELSDDVAVDEEDNLVDSQDQNTENTKVNVLVKDDLIKSDEGQTTSDEAPTNTLPEKSVLGEAWVIHLGSFKHKKNVDELLKKLKDNGYTAYTQPIKTKNGTLTKVIVGPELIQSELSKKLPELKDLTKVQGKIAKYNPTK